MQINVSTLLNSAVQSLYNTMFGSIGMDCVISVCVIKGQFYKRTIGK